mgnify:CR=1 FL=1
MRAITVENLGKAYLVGHNATGSYLSTLRKQSSDIYQALAATFQGNPPIPRQA